MKHSAATNAHISVKGHKAADRDTACCKRDPSRTHCTQTAPPRTLVRSRAPRAPIWPQVLLGPSRRKGPPRAKQSCAQSWRRRSADAEGAQRESSSPPTFGAAALSRTLVPFSSQMLSAPCPARRMNNSTRGQARVAEGVLRVRDQDGSARSGLRGRAGNRRRGLRRAAGGRSPSSAEGGWRIEGGGLRVIPNRAIGLNLLLDGLKPAFGTDPLTNPKRVPQGIVLLRSGIELVHPQQS